MTAMQHDHFLAVLNHLPFSDSTMCRTKAPLNKFREITEEIISIFKKAVKPGKKCSAKRSMIFMVRIPAFLPGKRKMTQTWDKIA